MNNEEEAMSKYKVSEFKNELLIEDGEFVYIELHHNYIPALEEYFQAKRDKELGRWRDPEYPHIFAKGRALDCDWVGVVKDNEEGLAYGQFRRGERVTLDPMSVVASRYFDAHPTPKPWHDAKQNELWELTIRGCITAPEVYRFAQDTTCVDSKVFRPVNNPKRVWFEASDNAIESARRIWPESKETTND